MQKPDAAALLRGTAFTAVRLRPWPILGPVVAAMIVAAAFVDVESFQSIIFFSMILWVLLMSRGLPAEDIRSGRWLLIFQNPVHPVSYYTRFLLISAGLMAASAVLIASSAAIGMTLRGASIPHVAGQVAGATVFGAALLCVLFGISACVRSAEMELFLLLTFVSMTQGVLVHVFHLSPRGEHVLSWLLIPLNALVGVWGSLTDARETLLTREGALQIVCYTGFWLALGAYQLRRLHRADASPL